MALWGESCVSPKGESLDTPQEFLQAHPDSQRSRVQGGEGGQGRMRMRPREHPPGGGGLWHGKVPTNRALWLAVTEDGVTWGVMVSFLYQRPMGELPVYYIHAILRYN